MIRKTLFLLMMSAFLASTQTISSCRSVKKSQARADSTLTRSEQISQTWTKETVTEISLPAYELLPYLEAGAMAETPEIFLQAAPEGKGIFTRLSFKTKKANIQKAKGRIVADPVLISTGNSVKIRKTERESGSIDVTKNEAKHVQTSDRDKAKESNPASWLIGISLAAITLLVCLIIRHQSKTRL